MQLILFVGLTLIFYIISTDAQLVGPVGKEWLLLAWGILGVFVGISILIPMKKFRFALALGESALIAFMVILYILNFSSGHLIDNLDPVVISSMSVCNAGSISEARLPGTVYGVDKFIVLDDHSMQTTFSKTDYPQGWRAENNGELSYVICGSYDWIKLQTCTYGNGDQFVERDVSRFQARVIVAQTGQTAQTLDLRGDEPSPCPSADYFKNGSTNLYRGPQVTHQQIVNALATLVQQH